MINLLKVLSELVPGQSLHIYPNYEGDLMLRLEVDFGVNNKPFVIATQQSLHKIKYHFEKGDLDEMLSKDIDTMINIMDESIINHEPESIYELDR